MFVKTLKTVELRGVTVLRDGLTVQTRLGQGYLADIGAPDVLSMRNPWRANPANAEPPRRAVFAVAADRDDTVAERAGRPGSPTGIPTFQGPTPCVDGRPSPGMSVRRGGPSSPAVVPFGPRVASASATGDEGFLASPPAHCRRHPASAQYGTAVLWPTAGTTSAALVRWGIGIHGL